jgi:ribosomal protein L19
MQSVQGENSDLFINGFKIHIQTEDWGPEKAILISRVFKDGGVHKTFKLAYEKIEHVENPTLRKKALGKLHQIVIDWSYKEI